MALETAASPDDFPKIRAHGEEGGAHGGLLEARLKVEKRCRAMG